MGKENGGIWQSGEVRTQEIRCDRLSQLQRLVEEGQPLEEEVAKATETAIRTAEQEADLIIDLSKPISRWRQEIMPEGLRQKYWKHGEAR